MATSVGAGLRIQTGWQMSMLSRSARSSSRPRVVRLRDGPDGLGDPYSCRR